MFQPEDDINRDRPSDINTERNLDNIDANISTQNVARRKQQLESIFFKLIAFGLACGAVLGVGAYYLINKLGLNKKPYELEPEKIEQKQQQKIPQQQTMFQKFETFPRISEADPHKSHKSMTF